MEDGGIDTRFNGFMMNYMDETEQRILSRDHYKELAKWLERVAILVLASLVVQKIVLGGISDPLIYVGLIISLTAYFFAYKLLIKS